jgi:D-3-phosphoglycerate dehydrogenase
MKFKVLLTDHPWPELDIEQAGLESISAELIVAPRQDADTLAELARDVDAILTCWAPVTAEVIAATTRCRIIARLGIGLDNIDLTAARGRGIMVTNVPDYCVEEVADHTWGLLLALTRQIGFFHNETKQGRYNLAAGPPIPRLRGLTLGLLGFGRTAQAVAARACPFGLRVLAWSRSGNAQGTAVTMTSRDEVLAASEILSLHLPLTPETRHIMDAAAFGICKPGQYLINTSRGGLIDHAALWQALQEGKLAGAGLDVFEPEPPDLQHPLYRDPRVIATPHAAFVSTASLVELRRRAVHQVCQRLRGELPENVVVPADPES